MPGMMDTVLNLGLNDETVAGLANASGDERFAYDSYRRFIQMYGDVVLGVEHHHFEDILADHKDDKGVALDTELEADDWKEVAKKFAAKVESELGKPFPQDPHDQLWGAISAVFGSWMNDRAKIYRKLHDIPENWSTAVNVQSMVFGNMSDSSATGVCFTRNPSTGENVFYGEYLINAQGEDVVAGLRTPNPLNKTSRSHESGNLPSLEDTMPKIYGELHVIQSQLEKHFKDMQDIEFTIQEGRLWMLQTRIGKRNGTAAIRMAIEMTEEGLIDEKIALMRINSDHLDEIMHPTLDAITEKNTKTLTVGLPAGPGGAAAGRTGFGSRAQQVSTGSLGWLDLEMGCTRPNKGC